MTNSQPVPTLYEAKLRMTICVCTWYFFIIRTFNTTDTSFLTHLPSVSPSHIARCLYPAFIAALA